MERVSGGNRGAAADEVTADSAQRDDGSKAMAMVRATGRIPVVKLMAGLMMTVYVNGRA